jgi:eukaryotic-like serine/threonine-protein kinase
MPLTAGAHLGPYEILAAIGAGGMGEMYRARDTKLNRDVALKVLPEAFTADPDRLARFKREAQVLASLNHPNIAHIHGFEDAGPTSALVMELVDGPTLAEMIQTRRGLPLDEALPIARQIAEALETAHELGIVHRDLKPANVKVRDDGTVKVLDFGLAKALSPENAASSVDAMNSPTLTAQATELGIILGTAVHGAGTGQRQTRRSPRRYLGFRRRALRNAHRPARIRSRGSVGDARRGPDARRRLESAAD